MKRIVSLTIALCLVLGSFSFCFADFSSTDSSNLSDIKSRVNQIWSSMPTYTQINGISSSLTTISNTLSTISSKLTDGNHSVAYLVNSIVSWMNPIYLRLQDILQATTNPAVNALTGLLGYPTTDSGTGVTTWNSYLASINAAFRSDPMNNMSFSIGPNGTYSSEPVQQYNFVTSTIHGFNTLRIQMAQTYGQTFAYQGANYNTSQTYTKWDDLTTSTFLPASIADGEYKWLSMIQAPVARLAYVLASDERIEAQEAAAVNEEAVVDNFIDSTGSGSVGVSDFGSLSDASGEMKSNFNTGQSAAGVFNVFDDSHFLYLSQSAADQLDTTGSNNRLLKSSGNDYDTPVLDRYYEELNKILEVNKDD